MNPEIILSFFLGVTGTASISVFFFIRHLAKDIKMLKGFQKQIEEIEKTL